MSLIQKISSKTPEKFKKIPRMVRESIRKNRLAAFVFFSLSIAILSVTVSLWAYSEFGTAELDLSRPSYQEARERARREMRERKKEGSSKKNFDSQGKIDSKTIEEFNKLYDAELKKIEGDFFNSDAFSDETLNIVDKKIEGVE